MEKKEFGCDMWVRQLPKATGHALTVSVPSTSKPAVSVRLSGVGLRNHKQIQTPYPVGGGIEALTVLTNRIWQKQHALNKFVESEKHAQQVNKICFDKHVFQ